MRSVIAMRRMQPEISFARFLLRSCNTLFFSYLRQHVNAVWELFGSSTHTNWTISATFWLSLPNQVGIHKNARKREGTIFGLPIFFFSQINDVRIENLCTVFVFGQCRHNLALHMFSVFSGLTRPTETHFMSFRCNWKHVFIARSKTFVSNATKLWLSLLRKSVGEERNSHVHEIIAAILIAHTYACRMFWRRRARSTEF